MNNLILLVLALAIIMFMMSKRENYDTVVRTGRYGYVDPYYNWRTYAPDEQVYDKNRLDCYPYNYKPKSVYARFNYYLPNFYKYGYGHW